MPFGRLGQLYASSFAKRPYLVTGQTAGVIGSGLFVGNQLANTFSEARRAERRKAGLEGVLEATKDNPALNEAVTGLASLPNNVTKQVTGELGRSFKNSLDSLWHDLTNARKGHVAPIYPATALAVGIPTAGMLLYYLISKNKRNKGLSKKASFRTSLLRYTPAIAAVTGLGVGGSLLVNNAIAPVKANLDTLSDPDKIAAATQTAANAAVGDFNQYIKSVATNPYTYLLASVPVVPAIVGALARHYKRKDKKPKQLKTASIRLALKNYAPYVLPVSASGIGILDTVNPKLVPAAAGYTLTSATAPVLTPLVAASNNAANAATGAMANNVAPAASDLFNNIANSIKNPYITGSVLGATGLLAALVVNNYINRKSRDVKDLQLAYNTFYKKQ